MLNDQDPHIQQIKRLIAQQSGLIFPSYKEEIFLRKLKRRMDVLGFKSWKDFYRALQKDGEVLGDLVELMTVNKSHFFRAPEQLVEFLKSIESLKSPFPSVWSAGCSAGQELYSLAMLAAEHFSFERFSLFGTDISSTAIKNARARSYRSYFAEKYEDVLEKYSKNEAPFKVIYPPKAFTISFQRHNLLKPLPFNHQFDGILCRNVLYYLDEPSRVRALNLFRRHLKSQGRLVLGAAEASSMSVEKYGFVHDGSSGMYRKEEGYVEQPVA